MIEKKSEYLLSNLFKLGDIETKEILKQCSKAHQALGELKGVAESMPNDTILISTLSLQEARESSAIENIITTQDELYRSSYSRNFFATKNAKEVHNYAHALQTGFQIVKKDGIITKNTIQTIQMILEENEAGFRKQAGTALVNEQTGETIYTPPQNAQQILDLMSDLERFINDNENINYDSLVKMALIHHQFESIHPFYDGNGRTGRILNILYLVMTRDLNTPILYLSRYINQNKSSYYRLLQKVREQKQWNEWLLFMLVGIEETAAQTTELIQKIKKLMNNHKQIMRRELPKIYSHDLLNNLFKMPYTKIEFVQNDINMTRQTCSKYLESLVRIGLLEKLKIGVENYYVNKDLFELLQDIPTKK